MEQVLLNQSRIPARMTWLKPISAAIAIGTGGPFGAEGPIIAAGGALGSLLGQVLKTSASERKILLAAGAAADAGGRLQQHPGRPRRSARGPRASRSASCRCSAAAPARTSSPASR
jgi:hypothetical protein